jgi:hypothetical protein
MQANWGITASVLYDRPPAFFKRTPVLEVHSLFSRIAPSLQDSRFDDCLSRWLPTAQQQQQGDSSASETLVTSLPSDATAGAGAGGQQAASVIPSWRSSRPALVISSTSWTPDEDFSILLKAGQLYDQAASQEQGTSTLPDVVFLITGMGDVGSLTYWVTVWLNTTQACLLHSRRAEPSFMPMQHHRQGTSERDVPKPAAQHAVQTSCISLTMAGGE